MNKPLVYVHVCIHRGYEHPAPGTFLLRQEMLLYVFFQPPYIQQYKCATCLPAGRRNEDEMKNKCRYKNKKAASFLKQPLYNFQIGFTCSYSLRTLRYPLFLSSCFAILSLLLPYSYHSGKHAAGSFAAAHLYRVTNHLFL